MKREHSTNTDLPSGYTRLEYIESRQDVTSEGGRYSGQYVNTGVNISGNLTVFADVEATGHSTNNDGFGLFGCRTATSMAGGMNFVCCTNYINTSSSHNKSLCDYYTTRTQVPTPSVNEGIDLVGERHTYEMTPISFLFDDVVKHTYQRQEFSSNKPMLLFDFYNGNARRNTAYVGRFYSCYILNGNTLIRDFVPALRLSDNKPGLYDICRSICPLTGTPFYVNAGTGEFLYK